jgi:hypothetical protein
MGAVIAAAAMAASRRLIRRLHEAGALSAATATEIAPRSWIEKRRLEHLERRGVNRRTGADRFYLDEAGLNRWDAERQRRVWLVLAIAMVFLGVLAGFLWSRHH